jgi:hypothetical protein
VQAFHSHRRRVRPGVGRCRHRSHHRTDLRRCNGARGPLRVGLRLTSLEAWRGTTISWALDAATAKLENLKRLINRLGGKAMVNCDRYRRPIMGCPRHHLAPQDALRLALLQREGPRHYLAWLLFQLGPYGRSEVGRRSATLAITSGAGEGRSSRLPHPVSSITAPADVA